MTRAARFGLLLSLLLALTGCASVPGQQVDRQAAASANARLGLSLLGNGQTHKALQRFKRALGYDAGNTRANWGMALAYQQLDQPDEARKYYRRVLADKPGPAVLNSYAVFLCKQGRTDQAVKYYERAADDSSNAEPAVALANAGLCLQRAGDDAAADAYYRKALSLDRHQQTALAHMARIQYERGNYLSARAFVERADDASGLSPEQLLLAARVELALGDREAAETYVQRHNHDKPSRATTLDALMQSGHESEQVSRQ